MEYKHFNAKEKLTELALKIQEEEDKLAEIQADEYDNWKHDRDSYNKGRGQSRYVAQKKVVEALLDEFYALLSTSQLVNTSF